MKKLILSFVLSFAFVAFVHAQLTIAKELWTFEDGAGLSFQGANAGFVNTGEFASTWNFGGFSGGASTDDEGNLVFTGGTANPTRKTNPIYDPAITSGKYRLSATYTAWDWDETAAVILRL